MRKKLLATLGSIVLLLVALVVILPNPEQRRLHAPERRQWKAQSIARITTDSRNTQMISNKIAELRTRSADDSGDDWIGTNVLLMTNGEFLVYSHIDAKQNSRIHDLFIAQGSDGKWYYSTFHFCISMITLRGEILGEPSHGSLAEFAQTYNVHQFDGESDECLQKTWPVRK